MFSDWTAYFWPQITDPWTLARGIYNLPWLFVVLQVLRPLGPWLALAILQGISVGVVLKMGLELRLPAWRMAMVVFSPPVLWGLFMGQFDGLFLLAYLVPPCAAVFLALGKPQVAVCAMVTAWQHRGAAIVAILLILSAWLVWGWPFACWGLPLTEGWNWAWWPWVGFPLLPLLLGDRRCRLFVSPFLFPYAGIQSLVGPMLAMATLPAWAFVGIWLVFWVNWARMVRLI